jgi:hypothetical protein
MKRTDWTLTAVVAALALALACAPSAGAQGGSVTIQWGNPDAPDGPPGQGQKVKKGGPPPHAPAHGYRAKHQYRYYPCCQAYYDTGRRAWFYIRTGQWTVGASIPTELKAQLGPYVNISLDTDRPYDHFDEHRQDYPAEKYKKKKI